MATDSRRYITGQFGGKDGVHELYPRECRDGNTRMATRFCWSRAVAYGALRNDISDRDLEALNVRANAGNPIAKRAMELLENGETLTPAWRRQVDRLIA